MDFEELQFVKMSSRAVVPTRATKYSIGLDLHSPDNYLIRPKKQVLIPTQIKSNQIRILWKNYFQILISYTKSSTCGCRSY